MEYRDEACKNLMILTLRVTDTLYLKHKVSLQRLLLFLSSLSTAPMKMSTSVRYSAETDFFKTVDIPKYYEQWGWKISWGGLS